jgi:hypothetical protein
MAANKRLSLRASLPLIALFILTNILVACDSGGSSNRGKPDNALEITFAYSSEKKPWIGWTSRTS